MSNITTRDENIPLPAEWLEEYQETAKLRDAAAASLNSSTNDNPLAVSPEDVTLACLQESRVL